MRAAGFGLAILASVFALQPEVSSQSTRWPIREFEVRAVHPTGRVAPFGAAVDLLRRLNVDPDVFETLALDDYVKTRIEDHLRRSAMELEAWGFPPPALEPVVETADGRRAFRVYVVDGIDEGVAGVYHSRHCRGGSETVITLNAQDVIERQSGTVTWMGLSTAGHELFHAVQFATPFFGDTPCGERVGDWITEGQARAVGVDLARQIQGEGATGALYAWGIRNYSRRLPVPLRQDLLPGDPLQVDPAYQTGSFWRYLAEYQAARRAGGSWPGAARPARNASDYSYLATLLQRGHADRDCYTAVARCNGEVRWLDVGVRSIFGRTLREVFGHFMDAYVMYAEARRFEEPAENLRSDSFDNSCALIELGPAFGDRTRRDRVDRFEALSAQCWDVKLSGFSHDMAVAITIDSSAATMGLANLTGALGGDPVRATPPDLSYNEARQVRRATWIETFPHGHSGYYVLANMADDPLTTQPMTNLVVTFTVLESVATMGGPGSGAGPSAAAIAAPIPLVNLDHIVANVVRDSAAGPRACTLRFVMTNSTTGSGVELGLTRNGPIGPGEYDVYQLTRSSQRVPQERPGEFLLMFGLGAGDSLSEGHRQNFLGQAGRVVIDSVTAGLVMGRVEGGVGTRSRYERTAVDWPPGAPSVEFGLPGLVIDSEFAVLVTDPRYRLQTNQNQFGSDCLTLETTGRPVAPPPVPPRRSSSGAPAAGGTAPPAARPPSAGGAPPAPPSVAPAVPAPATTAPPSPPTRGSSTAEIARFGDA